MNKKISLGVFISLLCSCSISSYVLDIYGLKKGEPIYCLGKCTLNDGTVIVSGDDSNYIVSDFEKPYLYIQKQDKQITGEQHYSVNTAEAFIHRDHLILPSGKYRVEEGNWISNKQIADDFNKKYKERFQELLAQEKQRQLYLTKVSKKSGGKPWCKGEYYQDLYEANNGKYPHNCLFKMPRVLTVLQQTSDGTLANLVGTGYVYMVIRNKTDSALVDKEFLPEGVFMIVGSYSYINTWGSRNTVHKLKRIE